MSAICRFSWRGMKTNNVFKSRNRTQTAKERKTTLLATICSRNKHQSPCQPKQLWECVIADGRYRLRKCRKNSGTTSSPPTPFTTPTTPDKMCVCTKLRPEQDDQGGMTTYYGEFQSYLTPTAIILKCTFSQLYSILFTLAPIRGICL